MTRRVWMWCAIAFVALLVLALGISRWQLHREQRAHERSGLRADSLAAAADSSRRLAVSERDRARLLGDSLAGVERRVVQLPSLNRDPVDRATGRTSVARGTIEVTPGAVHTTVVSGATTVDGADVRTASFHVDSSRYTADAAVSLPAPPAPGTLALDVRFRPIAVEPRVQCGPPGPDGIRPATLAVLAPAGVTLEVGASSVDVHACNPDYGRPRGVRVSLGTAAFMALGASALTAWLVTR